jgi:uncharacterized protein (TIGR03663 family)
LDRPLAPSWQRIAALTAHWELVAYAGILIVGFVLRIWDVGARALHHDESLHAYYAWNFFAGHGYSYNPLMHGPFKFELVPLFYLLFGVSEFSARLLPVLLGTAMLPLPYFLRRYITVPGAIVASACLAISPVMVYFSRFIRDDIFLAFFSLVCFIGIVHYLERPRPVFLYAGAAALAFAITTMEAAYITIFIFGTFLFFEGIREWIGDRTGPVISAIRATSIDTWLTALSIFLVLLVLMYSTFFTNPGGVWDFKHPLTGPNSVNRTDILGGLTYWKAQHGVERGGQPWFYYLLTLPLYEQIGLFFGVAGMVYAAFRRSLARTFLVWWALLAFGLYSWAGEKMPWLTVHIALPLILLAGYFVGEGLLTRRRWAIIIVGSIFALFLMVEVHSTFALSYVDAANPTELLIYVQTSQDVPNVANELHQLSVAKFGSNSMPIGVDNTDVGGWPFIWYLRDFPKVTYTATFNQPACGGKLCAALVMLGPEFDANSSYLLKHYVVTKYRWNWWFPEDYKTWFPAHWNALLGDLQGKSAPGVSAFPTGDDWQHVWNWFVYRTPFGERGARLMYALERRDLVPGSKYFSTTVPGQANPVAVSSGPLLSSRIVSSFGSTGPTASHLSGPRDVATAPNGNVYIADTLNHRVVEYSPTGTFIRAWGSTGTSHGQFSPKDSPLGIALGPDGLVYVADTWNQRIEVFTQAGKFVRQWGGGPLGSGNGQFYGPRSLAISGNGRVYVADTGNKRIQIFSRTGKFLFAFGTAGSGPGQFNEPSSVALGPTGTVYVSDFWNQRVQAFSPSGTFLRSWPVADWVVQSYSEPYIAVSQVTGNVFVTDPGQQKVLEFTSRGALIGSLSSYRFTLPIGLAVTHGGKLVVDDPTANLVSVFSPPHVIAKTKTKGTTQVPTNLATSKPAHANPGGAKAKKP